MVRMVTRFVVAVVVVAALLGCGGADREHRSGSLDATRVTFNQAHDVAYRLPAGWHAARRSLTPHLDNPREVVAAGTGPLPSGGACAHLPSAALQAMGADDVLVTVQERYGDVHAFPVRRARFSLPAGDVRSEAEDCAGGHPTFTSSWFEFRDHHRGFHVLVAVGRSAPAARVRDARALLDSLRIEPGRTVRIDPDDAIPFDDASRGVHLVHPSAWRVYPQALTQAVSARDQIALGTFALQQRRPDPNCTPATALRARRPGSGFLFLFEYRGLSQKQLERFPQRPATLRLPPSAFAPYECMGRSWLVRFRDHGRAFQAHIYGGQPRRRQALAILDSLRIRAGR